MEKKQLEVFITEESFYTIYHGSNPLVINEQSNFLIDRYKTLYNLSFLDESEEFSTCLNYLIKTTRYLVDLIIKNPLIELERDKIFVSLTDDDFFSITYDMPFILNEKYFTFEWFNNLLDNIKNIFCLEIKESELTVKEYINIKNNNLSVASRIYFHLVENNQNSEDYPFAFIATYSKKSSDSKSSHTPLKNALIEFSDDRDKLLYLLSSVSKASQNSSLITSLMESGELFQPIYFTVKEAHQFLLEVKDYEQAGIMCRIPKWHKKNTNKITLKLDIKKQKSLSLQTLVNFEPTFEVDGVVLTRKEIIELLNQAGSLVLLKNKWINVNEENLNKMLAAFEILNDVKSDGLTLIDLLKIEFNANKFFNVKDKEVLIEVTQKEWYLNFKKELSNPQLMANCTIASSFKGSLRDYQQTGYNWLHKMLEYGLGACLADDMGLGKTIQVIAIIAKLMELNEQKILLIVPASLIMNWKKEFAKFSNIEPVVIHNQVGVKIEDLTIENKVYITTYKMASKLTEYEFDLLVIDEAQAIKNIGTKQTKDVKSIKSKFRIALSGTPIENNLGDLYSLFDFLNKGLLGNVNEFKKQTTELIENNSFHRIRNMIKPFLLRRLKSDKSIINDLPDKVENNEYATLTKKQIALYQKEVAYIEECMADEEKDVKGLILTSIMKFKQICNHPSQFLSDGKYDEKDSGKFEVLRRIAQTVKENNEKMIVFTQFKEMTEPINQFLSTIFEVEGFVLHGSTSIKNRDIMVSRFNSDEPIPYMVLSLKAGGTGLNLTKSNHVVHFDRWWNPAVENQATDRAYRIGQDKKVMVYKFITTGSIEEHIDDILNSKQQLSDNILANTGESWIANLSKKELLDLFKLGGN